jgi:fimbrial chaperone protein
MTISFFKHAIFILLLGAFVRADAGSFMVDPTRIELAPHQLSATLVIRNDDKEPVVIQVEPRAWSQKDGEDVYAPTRELLVTPPIITIPAGAEQILRIALRRPLDPQTEIPYRIYLLEVPPPPQAGFRGLQVALRISIPVFARPGDAAAPRAEWKVAYGAREHALRVVLANAGNAHLQVQEFMLFAPGSNTPSAIRQTAAYVLPGQSRDWLIKLDPSVRVDGPRLRLKAVTDAGGLDKELDLDKP